jgi:RecA-family ATPase
MSNLGSRDHFDADDDYEIPDVPEGYSIPAEVQEHAVEVSRGVWLPAKADLKWRSKHPSRDYIIEDIMPSNQIHLLAGPSGSGKTTLAFQLIDAFTKGEPFMGHRTKKLKCAYITGDRASNSVWETQDRLEMDFEVFSLVDKNMVGASLTDSIIPMLGSRPDFIYIDGFTGMCPQGLVNNYMTVAIWLASLQRYCQKMNITILGAVHTAKVREGEEILNVRQKVLGSVSWAGYSETVIVIEPADSGKDVESNKRVLYLCPRNKAEEKLYVYMEDGRLVIHSSHINDQAAAEFILETILPEVELTPNRAIDHKSLWLVAERKGVKRRTFDSWLSKLVDTGKLVRKSKGIYVVPGEPVIISIVKQTLDKPQEAVS